MLKYGPPTKLQKTLLPSFNHYIAEIYGVLLPLVIVYLLCSFGVVIVLSPYKATPLVSSQFIIVHTFFGVKND
jgi:hypothetical protein